jgi:hypothetical protein
LEALSAITDIGIHLILASATLSTLCSMAVIYIPTHKLWHTLQTIHNLMFIAIIAVASVVHVEISADTIWTASVPSTIIDW